jgi:hypothetical protein
MLHETTEAEQSGYVSGTTAAHFLRAPHRRSGQSIDQPADQAGFCASKWR